MTTTTIGKAFGYTVTVEGEQAASGAALVPEWFDGDDLAELGAWAAQHWLDQCQIPDDAACPAVTVNVTLDGASATYSV